MFNTGKRVTDFNSTNFLLKSIGVAIIVVALLKAFCTEQGLSRGRTNHNYRKRCTYLNCNHDGCDSKFRVIHNLYTNTYQLEMGVGCDHNHNFQQAPERGMTQEQKVVVLECHARDCGAPKKVYDSISYCIKHECQL